MNTSTIHVLNQLIETCTDGEKGFAIAAADVRDEPLKALLRGRSEERARFVGELQGAIRKLGGAPLNEGTIAGTLHRALMQLREALEIKSDRLVLEECERGERAALLAYDKAAKLKLAPELRAMLDWQMNAIRGSLVDIWSRLQQQR